MLFSPVRFHGVRVPGLRRAGRVLPRKVQEVPGLLQGGIGWQGIVPARAAKMGSIAVDKAIAKLGTPASSTSSSSPTRSPSTSSTVFEPEMPELVDEVMRREHPRLWRDLPPAGRRALVERVQAQLPAVVRNVTDRDRRAHRPAARPEDHGDRPVPRRTRRWWSASSATSARGSCGPDGALRVHLRLPARHPGRGRRPASSTSGGCCRSSACVVGWVTNALGMWLIFEPPEPRRILGIKVHGLFLRRQAEAAEVYAEIIADDVITLERIGDFLLDGPRGDRTRQLLADRDAARHRPGRRAGPRGRAGGGRRAAVRQHPRVGGHEARGPDDPPFKDPEFSREQADEDPRAGGPAHQGASAARLRRDDARGDQGGRVDALRPRGDHGIRRWGAPPADLRGGGPDDEHRTIRTSSTAARRRAALPGRPIADTCPGSPGSRPAPRGARRSGRLRHPAYRPAGAARRHRPRGVRRAGRGARP